MVNRRIKSCIFSRETLCLASLLIVLLASALSFAQDSIYANAAPQSDHPEKTTSFSQDDNAQASKSPQDIPAASLENQLIGQRQNKSGNLQQNNRIDSALPSLWQTAGSLLIVLALIIGAAYLFRRFSLGSRRNFAPAGIQIIGRRHVSPKQSLCLVKFGSRLLLVGLSPNHIAALDTIDDPEEVAHLTGLAEENKPDSITNTFGNLFQRASDIYQEQEDPAKSNFQTDKNPYWRQARGELTALLDKVKGLSRIRFRS